MYGLVKKDEASCDSFGMYGKVWLVLVQLPTTTAALIVLVSTQGKIKDKFRFG